MRARYSGIAAGRSAEAGQAGMASDDLVRGLKPKASLRVAAIQICAELGAVDANCARAERLVREAFARGAQWVVLPEFFTSGVAFHPSLLDAARPVDGEPLQLLKRLAAENSGVVGGSFIALRGADAYNTFVLAFGDGTTFYHDKDLPTMWENCYYVGGSDDGVFDTVAARVGVAMCWEMVRSQTSRRLLGKVDIVVGGSCWWDLPDGPMDAHSVALRARNLDILEATPARLAKMLGVPFVHASHAGEFSGLTPGDESKVYRSRWLGETQIVDGRGNVLARRSQREGEGVVIAEVPLGRISGSLTPIPDDYWIPHFPDSTLEMWDALNEHGREYYKRVTLVHRRG